MHDPAEEQRRLILDQFTRQAVPFSEMPAHSNEESVRLVMDMARIGPEDDVLDVACGPGLVACELAEVARHVAGIDLTPAMIEQAQAKQRSKGLTNLTWLVGDAVPLPFPDPAFSVVVTRYSFHHFLDPRAVLVEMVRVCQPGGRVAVIDVFTSNPEQAEAYNRVEKLRDPSHVRALSLEELIGLCHDAGLRGILPEGRRRRPHPPDVRGRHRRGSPRGGGHPPRRGDPLRLPDCGSRICSPPATGSTRRSTGSAPSATPATATSATSSLTGRMSSRWSTPNTPTRTSTSCGNCWRRGS
jgi:SAM-dependent methyltransferase